MFAEQVVSMVVHSRAKTCRAQNQSLLPLQGHEHISQKLHCGSLMPLLDAACRAGLCGWWSRLTLAAQACGSWFRRCWLVTLPAVSFRAASFRAASLNEECSRFWSSAPRPLLLCWKGRATDAGLSGTLVSSHLKSWGSGWSSILCGVVV